MVVMIVPRTPTQDLDSSIALPAKCINASVLYSLANALNRIASFHEKRGGAAGDEPCLTSVIVQRGTVIARIASGERRFKLELVRGNWEFR